MPISKRRTCRCPQPENPPTCSVPAHPLARCLTPRLGLHGCNGRASITGTYKLLLCPLSSLSSRPPTIGTDVPHSPARTLGPSAVGSTATSGGAEKTAGGTRPDQRCGLVHSPPSVTGPNTPPSRVSRQVEQRPSRQGATSACLARWSRDPPGRQFAHLDLTRFIHYLQGAPFSFWLHLDKRCRDAVKIDHESAAEIEQIRRLGDGVPCWLHPGADPFRMPAQVD